MALPGWNPYRIAGATPYPAGYLGTAGAHGSALGGVTPSPVAPPQTDDGSQVSPTLMSALTQPGGPQASQIGPPPSDAMAKALLANEQAMPLNRPLDAIGKLGALWSAQKSDADYQKAAYQRQVAPTQALAKALAAIPADTPPAQYRRLLAQAYMGTGGTYGSPEMLNQGAQMLATPTNYIQMKDAAGNDYLVNPYDMTDVHGFDASGQLVRLNAPPQGLTPAADGSAAAGQPRQAGAGANGAPGGDPYAALRLPRNIKQGTDAEGYNAYLAQEIAKGTPPEKIQSFKDYSLDRTRAGAQNLSVITSPEKTLGDALAGALSKRYVDFAEGVEGASQRQRQIHAMQGALDRVVQNGGTTGLGAEEIKNLQSQINVGANLLGLDQPFDIADKDFLSSGARQIAGAAAKSAVGARVTNFELDNYLKANAGLQTSPTFGKRMLGINEQTEQRNIDVGNAIRDVSAKAIAEGKKPDPQQLEKIIRDYDAAHHIVDPVTGQDLTVNPALPEFNAKPGAVPPRVVAPGAPGPGGPPPTVGNPDPFGIR